MKKRPEIIDAEFEVVSGAPPVREKWNGVGIPPEWSEWNWFGRITYIVVYGGLLTAIFMAKQAITGH